jgi:hypothetical protein
MKLNVITYHKKTKLGKIEKQTFIPLNIQIADSTGEKFEIGLGEKLDFYVDLRINNPKAYVKIDNFCVPLCSYESVNNKLAEIFSKYSIREKFNELKVKAKL